MANRLAMHRGSWRANAGFAVVGAAAIVGVIGLSLLLPGNVGENLTRNTVRLSLAWYAAALLLALRFAPGDRTAVTPRGWVARWCWTWGIVTFLVHLAMAFHYYHHWSHAHAFARTREVSGVGEGIYVSYFFTWLWLLDCAWWWARPESYARRSAWIDRGLHAFMLMIVFNGMVVFEQGPIRWAGLLLFAVLGAAWWAARRKYRLRYA